MDETSSPIDGPAQEKMPTTMRIKHADMPEIEDAAPGDEVHMMVHGHVHSNRMKDKYGDGEAEVDIHKMEHVKAPKKSKKENAANMPMDKLKSKIDKDSY